MIYPLHSYYYTSNANFSPNGSQSDLTINQSEDWTYNGKYKWLGPVEVTQGSSTVYRWQKEQDPNYTP